jgi:hypothetical protein
MRPDIYPNSKTENRTLEIKMATLSVLPLCVNPKSAAALPRIRVLEEDVAAKPN